MSNFKFDTSDFDRGFKKAMNGAMKGAKNGMKKASVELLDDARNQDPKVPVKTGALSKSGYAETRLNAQTLVAEVGFRKPYAAKLHELGPTQNRKYLEQKLYINQEKYFGKTILEEIQRGMK